MGPEMNLSDCGLLSPPSRCGSAAPFPAPSVPPVSAPAYASRLALWRAYQQLRAQGCTLSTAERALGVSDSTLSRLAKAVAAGGEAALLDGRRRSGRHPAVTFTAEETQTLSALYLRTNRAEDAGSMLAAAKIFALDPHTREELRAAILPAIERRRVPGPVKKILQKITPAHFAATRRPKMIQTEQFSGSVGAFVRDKIDRRRVVESDDGTLNFAATIPWPQGGDPCSDKYGVRLGRWQFLPALEAGWSHYYLGYVLVARPRGSYTQEDVRSVISMVLHQHGLPDEFRFERGTWECNSIVNLIESLGIRLSTVHQSNHKPYIEGGFSALWTYLSIIDGQVGRYRGDQDITLVERCRAGRANPLDHFPALSQCIQAIDGALALRNSDTIHSSIYGEWVPEVRHRELAATRPWPHMPAELDYLFAPYVRDWTVTKGAVGRVLTICPGLGAPFYFIHDDLWRWNGHPVRLYFDPAADRCVATIVSLQSHAGYKPGDIICRAELFGELPHFARAAMGWAAGVCPRPTAAQKGPLAAVRRETRALAPGGRIRSATTFESDGLGNRATFTRSNPVHPVHPVHAESAPPIAPERITITAPADHEPSEPIERVQIRPRIEPQTEHITL